MPRLGFKPHIASSYLRKEIVTSKREPWENFEILNDWHAADWADKVKVSLSKENATSGQKCLKIVFDKQGRRTDGKGIVIQKQSLSLDLSKAKEMVFDIYLDAPNSAEVSIVLNSLGFCESVRKILLPGWNKNVTFDLTAKTFKKESTRWLHSGELDRNVPIQEVMLIFYPWDVEAGKICIDNIGFLNQ